MHKVMMILISMIARISELFNQLKSGSKKKDLYVKGRSDETYPLF